MNYRAFTHILWMMILFQAAFVDAQIAVEGVADTTDYTVPVPFRVVEEAGYTYQATLDDQSLAVGPWHVVSGIGYHQIDVTRTNDGGGGPVETARVRFVLIDPARGTADRGLPNWIPWPLIDSSSNECSSAHLLIVAPSNYPAGLPIPVVAVTEGENGL